MKTIVNSSKAPLPVGPYNQAVLAGNTLYISGQIAINQAEGNLINDSIEAILLTMHREDFSSPDPGDTAAPAQACSLYMKELQAFLERISKDFLSTFTCREFVSLHLFSMAEKTIERWMI